MAKQTHQTQTSPSTEWTPQQAAAALAEVGDQFWTLTMESSPLYATMLGDHRFDDRLPDASPESRDDYYQRVHGMLEALDAIPPASLSPADLISLEVLRDTLAVRARLKPFFDEQWSINPLHGPWSSLAELTESHPVHTQESFEHLKTRFRSVPVLMQQIRSNLEAGLDQGLAAPHIGPERVAAQLLRMVEIPIASSSFMLSPESPGAADDSDRTRMNLELRDIVSTHVYPALQDLGEFLGQRYLPKARRTAGLCHLPQGRAYYQALVELHTGLQEDAEHIHQIGLEEMSRLHLEMESIAEETLGRPDIRALAHWLREQAEQYLPSPQALLEHNRAIIARAYEALPRAFSLLPTTPCEVRAIEAYREADSPSGYYVRAPQDGSRPAYYYVNTYQPSMRPLFNMEALAFHEAVPGHHLQVALAQEIGGLPDFRRIIHQTAYVEGWALYSERLCDELGLYSSQFTRFGMLNYQVWRAARLVVDTGLHALGWSREQALKCLLDNTAHTEREAIVEIDRYICMPGQALSYMIGRIAIDRLRRQTQERLGRAFDLKEFHARVLENGSIPLTTLEHLLQRWDGCPSA